jgi:hypothetical protein
MKRGVVTFTALLCAPLAGAHHSYGGYDMDERSVLDGTLTDVHWANPHILLSVSEGDRTMTVEWMTLTGAEPTGVSKEELALGERIIVTGSRNKDPAIAIMMVVKEVELPTRGFLWERTPSRQLP